MTTRGRKRCTLSTLCIRFRVKRGLLWTGDRTIPCFLSESHRGLCFNGMKQSRHLLVIHSGGWGFGMHRRQGRLRTHRRSEGHCSAAAPPAGQDCSSTLPCSSGLRGSRSRTSHHIKHVKIPTSWPTGYPRTVPSGYGTGYIKERNNWSLRSFFNHCCENVMQSRVQSSRKPPCRIHAHGGLRRAATLPGSTF